MNRKKKLSFFNRTKQITDLFFISGINLSITFLKHNSILRVFKNIQIACIFSGVLQIHLNLQASDNHNLSEC